MGLIRFKKLSWSNAFSYGPDNVLLLDQNPIVQLVGKNGHGKSSIALILEEVLFNKNSKGVKKANILNRYAKSKSYSITLDFDCGEDSYQIATTRGSTQTVVLTKNGQDISSHTSTGTYKLIEEILGYDHKTFTQIVYQSNPFSLEFLTATDTARKKFLIDLLNLTKYSELGESFKEIQKEVSKNLEIAEALLKSSKNWLDSFAKKDTSFKEPVEVPEKPTEIEAQVAELKVKLSNIAQLNSKITKNNQYKALRDSIEITVAPNVTYDLTAMSIEVSELTKEYEKLDKVIKGTGPIYTKCPSCGQAIDSSHKATMLEEAKMAIAPIREKLVQAKNAQSVAKAEIAKVEKAKQDQAEWEKYHTLWDPTLESTLLDSKELEQQIKKLTAQASAVNEAIQQAIKYNSEVAAHNAKSKVLLEQKAEMEQEKLKAEAQVAVLADRLSILQILTKTFSPGGLIAYKIEVLVKDLEAIANKYLQDMSGGRFQLTFKLNSSDKLDVVITDSGKDIEIYALSNGELARVNISTLLAIRKLMQSISDTKTNLLILDETVESLDVDGKEKLIEVLLQEEHLNTILVSHGFSHPLLEKVGIVKTNNISRIE